MFTQEDLKNIKDGLVELTADRNVQDIDEETWQSILNTLDKVDNYITLHSNGPMTVKVLKEQLSLFDEDMEVFVCTNEEYNGDGRVIIHSIFSVDEYREGCGIFI